MEKVNVNGDHDEDGNTLCLVVVKQRAGWQQYAKGRKAPKL